MKQIELAAKLGVTVSRPELWLQALTHRSYINEQFALKEHNERLEFLGNAVIELSVTKYLYENYPNPEGDLTNWRSGLVNAGMLGKLAKNLGFEDYLLLSRGERKGTDKARMYILANAFEAVVGAIFLDRGMEEADRFLRRHLISQLQGIIADISYFNPKSRFQDMTQEKYKITPTYQILSEIGPDHNKKFIVGAFIGDEMVSKGEGTSKREAQVMAARNGLKAMGWQ